MHNKIKIIIALCKVALLFCLPLKAQEIFKENLGTNINTQYSETKPLISPDGKILYFARQNYPENIKGEKDEQDIYYSIHVDNEWTKAVNIGAPLNDKYPNGVSSVSTDGNSLLVINAYNEANVGSGASISYKSDEGWTFPESISINNFYNLNAYVDYFIASSEKELFLAIQTEDSYGDQDLYVSFKEGDFLWSTPINLGAKINTEGAEFSPFLAADNKTLFFASTGHEGYGKSDIFYSKRLDDTWQNWTEPVNLGSVINSEGFEAYYTIPASGEFAYYVSDKGSVNDSKDIYQSTIPYQFRPDPVVMITGTVFNKNTKEPLEAVITFSSLTDKTEDYGIAVTNNENGKYSIILPRGHEFNFIAYLEGYLGIAQYRNTLDLKEYIEIPGNMGLTPVQEGEFVDIFDISFERNTANILPESIIELDRLAAFLLQYPALQVEIAGHSNQLRLATDNLKLSEERADKIKQYFNLKNIEKERIVIRGYGNSRPFSGNKNSLNPKVDPQERITLTFLSTTWAPAPDMDKDGIPDEEDACPEMAGIIEFKGCSDSDKDSIPDNEDECPMTFGLPENKGCPKVEEKVAEVLKEALEGIGFESGKDIITKGSYPILDKVVEMLNEYPDYKLRISGHTDNVGKAETNLILSHRRAQATMKYLIDHGIDASRIDAAGYGDQKPVADNATADGRSKNRRVEFEIVFN